jgi:hypothetical protein
MDNVKSGVVVVDAVDDADVVYMSGNVDFKIIQKKNDRL